MPSTATSTMLAATMDYRGPTVYEQVIQKQPFYAWLTANGRMIPWEQGGENIEVILATDWIDTFAARDYKTPLDFKEQDPLEVVEIPSRWINGHIMWYNAQEEANVGNKAKIIDFVNALIDRAQKSAKTAFALEMWQGGTGEHLHGLPAILSASNTYMGKDRSTAANAYWRAKTGASFTITWPDGTTQATVACNTATTLEMEGAESLTTLYDDLTDNGGTDGPDFGITGPALYRRLIILARDLGIEYKSEKMMEIGFPDHLAFRGAPIVWDRNCGAVAGTPDATTFIFLNSNHLVLRPYVGYSETFKASSVQDLQPTGVLGKAMIMQWHGNIVCTQPGKQGMLTNKLTA